MQPEAGKEEYGNHSMIIGNKKFDIDNHTYLMGILNVTPDSFSDGGRYKQIDSALFHVEEMIRDGMDILDVGGESTRPGYIVISEEEEIQRTVPVIEAVKSRFDIPVSLDTYKSEVAEAGIQAGADLINDIWGLKYDGRMALTIAQKGVSCCLMHNRKEPDYKDFMKEMLEDIKESVSIAVRAGIDTNQIIIDPGVGFGKTYENNLTIIRQLEELTCIGYPILLGTSRKSVIGLTLNLPVQERVEGTLVTTVMAVMKGCAFIRVHDIKQNRRAICMAEAILNRQT